MEWDKLHSNTRASPSNLLSEKRILEFIRSHPNSNFHVCNSFGLTYLTRLYTYIHMYIYINYEGN